MDAMRRTPTLVIDNTQVPDRKRQPAKRHNRDISDISPDIYFDYYTRLITDIFRVPMAAVSLIEDDRQWFKSSVGIDLLQTPLEECFGVHSMEQNILEVPDTLEDDFFRHHPMVLNSPFIRFYMGIVLCGPTGQPLGTLCVMDTQPRYFTRAQRSWLVKFSHLIWWST